MEERGGEWKRKERGRCYLQWASRVGSNLQTILDSLRGAEKQGSRKCIVPVTVFLGKSSKKKKCLVISLSYSLAQ